MPYCGKCGKWLEEGQTCSCGAAAVADNYAGRDPAHMYRSDYRYAENPAPGAGMPNAYPGDMGGYGANPDPGSGYDDGGYGPAGGAGHNPYDGLSYIPEPPKPGIKAAKPSEVISGIAPFLARIISTISALWIRFKNRVGLGEPETNDVDYYERNLEIVPQCIDPDSGEMPIKQYDMAVLRTRLILSRAEGRLQVTNKRVIFRATGRSLMGRTTLQHEFAIDEISGIKLRKDHRFSFLNYLGVAIVLGFGIYVGAGIFHRFEMWDMPGWLIGLLTLLITGLAFIPFFLLYKKFPLKLLLVSVGYGMILSQQQRMIFYRMAYNSSDFAVKMWGLPVILVGLILLFIGWIICWVPNLIVNIETKGTQPAVEIRRKESGILNFFRKPDYTGFAEVLPWRDTELAIIELWAMVSDIQKYGDEAIKQWKK